MENVLNKQTINLNALFDKDAVCPRGLYLSTFGCIPSEYFISDLQGEKACNLFRTNFGSLIEAEYEYKWFDSNKKKYVFGDMVFLLKNKCIVELKHYCQILHSGEQQAFIDECTALMLKCKGRKRRVPLEVNMIVKGSYGMELKSLEIKRTSLDLDLFYEDDFKEVDHVIRSRLSQKNDKGIVLLHGLPGTGKTTYLRYLVGKIKKRVMFLSPNMAESLTDPGFIDLLIENPNSVVIIEDAENILLDRKVNARSGVANLLNISDGLLADFLNVQLICTFNSPLTMVDTALTRKGRLIARYHFDKLSVRKARRLSEHLGMTTDIRQPMTVSEICNQKEKDYSEKKTEIVGFRTSVFEN